ncbi:nuclear transport factor 2 family protein [Kordiimonas sp.]|uniref:nuclear transport factor 2 family protein n=1 Tax=Kordiimonas sp. TaxID=1970157 RepID=UPI003A8FDAB3
MKPYLLPFAAIIATMATALPCYADSAQEALEQANLEKAVYCMEVLEVEFDLETAGQECFGDTYIQHSPHVPDGKEGVLGYFAKRFEKFPNAKMEIKRASADGDLVWIHLHFQRTPDVRGNAVIHIFRMEDGKFVEHWGVGQPVPETSVHGNSIF